MNALASASAAAVARAQDVQRVKELEERVKAKIKQQEEQEAAEAAAATAAATAAEAAEAAAAAAAEQEAVARVDAFHAKLRELGVGAAHRWTTELPRLACLKEFTAIPTFQDRRTAFNDFVKAAMGEARQAKREKKGAARAASQALRDLLDAELPKALGEDGSILTSAVSSRKSGTGSSSSSSSKWGVSDWLAGLSGEARAAAEPVVEVVGVKERGTIFKNKLAEIQQRLRGGDSQSPAAAAAAGKKDAQEQEQEQEQQEQSQEQKQARAKEEEEREQQCEQIRVVVRRAVRCPSTSVHAACKAVRRYHDNDATNPPPHTIGSMTAAAAAAAVAGGGGNDDGSGGNNGNGGVRAAAAALGGGEVARLCSAHLTKLRAAAETGFTAFLTEYCGEKTRLNANWEEAKAALPPSALADSRLCLEKKEDGKEEGERGGGKKGGGDRKRDRDDRGRDGDRDRARGGSGSGRDSEKERERKKARRDGEREDRGGRHRGGRRSGSRSRDRHRNRSRSRDRHRSRSRSRDRHRSRSRSGERGRGRRDKDKESRGGHRHGDKGDKKKDEKKHDHDGEREGERERWSLDHARLFGKFQADRLGRALKSLKALMQAQAQAGVLPRRGGGLEDCREITKLLKGQPVFEWLEGMEMERERAIREFVEGGGRGGGGREWESSGSRIGGGGGFRSGRGRNY